MLVFNTYQEAKIENKDSEILKARDDWQGREELIGKFIANKPDKVGGIPCVGEGYFEICNAADYCISVSELHEKGLELVHGDLYELEGSTYEFGGLLAIGENVPKLTNKNRYILRAKALEQPKQECEEKESLYLYEVVDCKSLEFWECAKEYQSKLGIYWKDSKGKHVIQDLNQLVEQYKTGVIYRRVEITERDLFIDTASRVIGSFSGGDYFVNEVYLGALFDSGKFKLVDDDQ